MFPHTGCDIYLEDMAVRRVNRGSLRNGLYKPAATVGQTKRSENTG